YEHAVERAVKGLCKAGDILVLFSTSGGSSNLLNAAHAARALGVKVISILGKDGGELARHSDCSLIVPSQSSDTIQE
ncbi:SIS domain-containing protein, partial [Klebsiella pneumoniae]|uniref:SIS domain-containing protein n=1 Tax=Klebsiella pneumoniae TaxID=573 RepID=UPI003851A00D